jgi:putative endonuclease
VKDPRHQLGRVGEDLAARHLERLGYDLVARNFRTRYGELDLVVRDGAALVFVEVKTRRARGPRDRLRPWENLPPAKRAQVRRMAAAYLRSAPDRPFCSALRFDAIGIIIDARGRLVAVEHLEAAF